MLIATGAMRSISETNVLVILTENRNKRNSKEENDHSGNHHGRRHCFIDS
jgi:hypothetical protein